MVVKTRMDAPAKLRAHVTTARLATLRVAKLLQI